MNGTIRAFCAIVLSALFLLATGAPATFGQAASTMICSSPSGGFSTGATASCNENLGEGGTAAMVSLGSSVAAAYTLIAVSPTGTVACTPTTAISFDGSSATVSCAANTGFFTGLVETFAISSTASSGSSLTQTVSCTPAVSSLTGGTLTAGPGSCGNGAAVTVVASGVSTSGGPVTVGVGTSSTSTLINVTVDRGAGATYYAGQPISICISLNLGGPNIYQSNTFPARLTDQVSGSGSIVIFRGLLPASGQQCLTRAISAPFGAETITADVFDPLSGARIASGTVTFTSAANPSPVPPTLNLVASSTTAAAGQTLSFTANATPSSGAFLQSLTLNFGDGTVLALNASATVSHAYALPGTYTATLIAVDSLGAVASTNTTITVTALTPPPPPGASVTYPTGWNMVAGPTGTTITGNLGPLYTYPPGASTYSVFPAGTPLAAGLGFWAYFSAPTTQNLPPAGPLTIVRPLPAGQWVMIGDPGSGPATVSGADVVYVYDPVRGYTATTTLQPGQGAWAFSFGGSLVSISSTSS